MRETLTDLRPGHPSSLTSLASVDFRSFTLGPWGLKLHAGPGGTPGLSRVVGEVKVKSRSA